MIRFIVSIGLMLSLALSSHAQISEAELDIKARDIGQSLRCVVCQNQNINESDAPLAEDMRALVRKQLSTGKTEDEIIAYMRDNYGDYVLLKPPVQNNTIILWFGPILLLVLLLIWFARHARNTDAETEL